MLFYLFIFYFLERQKGLYVCIFFNETLARFSRDLAFTIPQNTVNIQVKFFLKGPEAFMLQGFCQLLPTGRRGPTGEHSPLLFWVWLPQEHPEPRHCCVLSPCSEPLGLGCQQLQLALIVCKVWFCNTILHAKNKQEDREPQRTRP